MLKCSYTIPTIILWKYTLFCGNASDFTPAMQRNSNRKLMINELNDSSVLRYGNYRQTSKDLHSEMRQLAGSASFHLLHSQQNGREEDQFWPGSKVKQS